MPSQNQNQGQNDGMDETRNMWQNIDNAAAKDEDGPKMEVEQPGQADWPMQNADSLPEPGKVEAEVVQVEGDLAGHVEPVEEELIEAEKEYEEFKESFWDILEQAGISKSKLIWIFLIVFLAVVLLFALLFGWFSGSDTSDSSDVSSEEDLVEESLEQEEIEGLVRGSSNFGIINSYIFGLESTLSAVPRIEAEPITSFGDLAGLDAAYAVGASYDPYRVNFEYYVALVREMENMINTDVYELMDLSLDRREALNDHLNDMYRLIEDANIALTEIEIEIARLEADFEEIVNERDLHEEAFFLSMQELMGAEAYDYLELFIVFEQKAAETKAVFNSYVTVGEMIIADLDIIEPRYDDILINAEALIKGIRVFDIPKSDIEAIIPLEQ